MLSYEKMDWIMDRRRITTCLLVGCLALAAGCSARPERFRHGEGEAEQAAKKNAEERSIPKLAPLKFREGEVPVKELESQGPTRSYRVGDVLVIQKRTTANRVVAAKLYIVGGSANLTDDSAGIEQLAMKVAVTGGTESTPKDDFNRKLDSTGSSVYSFNERDDSGYGLKTLVSNFDETWDLFQQAVLEPAMPKDEVEIRRTKQLAQIASMLEDPDSHVSYVAARRMFENHPYYHLQVGTKKNVESFSREELLAYQRHMLRPERMILVVVGDVPTKTLLDKVKKTFGRLAPSGASPGELPKFTSHPGAKIVDRKLPTNYVLGFFSAPSPGDPDYPALLVATDYLRNRLFEEVRTKRNLTYAVSAGLSDKRANYGYLYVTATDPKKTMKVIFDQIAEMKLIEIPKADLDQTVNVFITHHFMDLETNGSQASTLATAQITAGDWKQADGLLEKIRAVTPEDVQRVATKYIANYRFGVVGQSATKADFVPE